LRMQNLHYRPTKSPACIISIAPKDFTTQREVEKQLSSAGIEYQLHSTAGVFCIWCGLPITIVNDMKIYNDGRIMWLTKHCRKEYVVIFNVTKLEQAAGLPDVLREAMIQSRAVGQGDDERISRPDAGQNANLGSESRAEKVENAERPL